MYARITSFDHVHVWLPEHANCLSLTYSLGCFLTTLDLHVQIQEPGPWWPSVVDQSAQWKHGLAIIYSKPLFFQPPLISSQDSHLSTREYFSAFLYCISCFALSGDLIFLEYCIMLCDNCVLVLFCWNVYYHCAFVLWFFYVLMLSVYMWGYFRPEYIRRSNVSLHVGSGHYIFIRIATMIAVFTNISYIWVIMKTAISLYEDWDLIVFTKCSIFEVL